MSKIEQKIKAKRRIRVVQYWALGATLNETVKLMKEEGYRISVATAHRDRHSTTAQQYIDELIRNQLRDIARGDLDQKLNYRDKLLGKLVPQKIEALSYAKTVHVEEKRDVTIVADYTREVEAAVKRDLEALRARKQMDT